MKKRIVISIFFVCTTVTLPQSKLTLEECYNKARANYPLIKQKEYIARIEEYNVSNVWKGYFPQITISGQTTYQSDVTTIPFSFPGIKIESLTQDQYKAAADISQVIYDGGIMSAQAEIQRSSAEVDDQKVEVEMMKVKERINQIYFGILLSDAQISQIDLVKKDLIASLDKITAALQNGITTQSSVDIIKAELLKTNQKEIEAISSRKTLIDILCQLIKQKLDEPLKLEQPSLKIISTEEEINRPELKLFESQTKMIEIQNELTLSKILPKASLFFQGGYGKPTLNMLKNNFDWYYITGARLTWSPSNLYTFSNEKEIIELSKKSIDVQKETYLLNTNISLNQQKREIEKLRELIVIDKQIIDIRTTVKESSRAQLENGVITASDYIRELNAEDQVKQNLAVHTIQLLLANQNYQLSTGN
jgi:outer membrane protein TolC